MADTHAHLCRLLDRVTAIFADEVLNCTSLSKLYPGIGDLHPAICREGHVQGLLLAGLRASGYYTVAEANYFVPSSNSRQIDLAVWLPDVARWLYLEVKPCHPLYGYQGVLDDAEKLRGDSPTDTRDQLRGVLTYGFRGPAIQRDFFPKKYQELGAKLIAMNFQQIGMACRSLDGTDYSYVQAGLWVLGA
jgi:hypothetical protein